MISSNVHQLGVRGSDSSRFQYYRDGIYVGNQGSMKCPYEVNDRKAEGLRFRAGKMVRYESERLGQAGSVLSSSKLVWNEKHQPTATHDC